MGTDLNTSIANAAAAYQTSGTKVTQSTDTDTKEAASTDTKDTAAANNTTGFSEAAVYEKSSDDDSSTAVNSTAKNDRSAIVSQLKADAEQRASQLLEIVRKTMEGQGKAIGTADDMWRFLAGGDFTVDAETKAKAQADIAEDGYWGVEQTSDRILDFAKALAGDDPEKADQMLEAFKKGFEQATKSWGKELPDISKNTYDSVLKKFDDWKNSANKNADTSNTDNTKAAADEGAGSNSIISATASE